MSFLIFLWMWWHSSTVCHLSLSKRQYLFNFYLFRLYFIYRGGCTNPYCLVTVTISKSFALGGVDWVNPITAGVTYYPHAIFSPIFISILLFRYISSGSFLNLYILLRITVKFFQCKGWYPYYGFFLWRKFYCMISTSSS